MRQASGVRDGQRPPGDHAGGPQGGHEGGPGSGPQGGHEGGPERGQLAPDLVAIEHEVLARWAADLGVDAGRSAQTNPGFDAAGSAQANPHVDAGASARTGGSTTARPRWVCYSDPPAAAGLPGLQHVSGQVVTDMYERLKVMQGFDVSSHGAMDCHGLAVEVAVEKELGLAGPADIEAYGAERFTARCREFAARHAAAFSALSTRLGCRPDAGGCCRTMDARYIESVWWSLRQIFDAGLLERSYRVTPYCARCQTPLSVHDLDHPDARRRAEGTGVIVRLRLATLPDGADPRLHGADLLAWTARPWTLVSNAAIAVHPHQTYVLARLAGRDDRVIVAQARLSQVLGEDWHVAARFSGAELAGASYHAVLNLAGVAGPRPVIGAYFVTMCSGTGLLPLAPAYGTDDNAAARAHGLPAPDPVGQDGRFAAGLPLIGGVFFADADPRLIAALSDAGALFAARRHQDGGPQCWRCGSPLLFRALSAWYIRTTAVRDRLHAASEQIRWDPPAGTQEQAWSRFGAEADWAVSRTRYWGTPLPLWECSGGHLTCVSSLTELSELAGRNLTGSDPHRPQLDGVIIACPQCRATARRVPEVLDARYDAGWLPFARQLPPGGTRPGWINSPPAQLVVTKAGQAGGWPGALMTISTLVFGRPMIRSALGLGAVLDENGRMMSRSLGNLAEPLPLIERYGADALRWFCAVAAPPAATRTPSEAAIGEIASTVLRTYLNAAALLLDSPDAAARPRSAAGPADEAAPPPTARPLSDRWLLSALRALIAGVTAALEEFRPADAGASIVGFLDALWNWYLPTYRSRVRLTGHAADRAAAIATLRDCIDVLTRVMAPITPLLTDHVWTRLRASATGTDRPDSVHQASWPVPGPALVDDWLADQVAMARRLAGLGRSARVAAGVKSGQPLARAVLAADGITGLPAELRQQLARALNVRSVELLPLDRAQAILSAADSVGTGIPPPGWAVAADGRELAALDPTVPQQARAEGGCPPGG